jgi:hypothetical protein
MKIFGDFLLYFRPFSVAHPFRFTESPCKKNRCRRMVMDLYEKANGSNFMYGVGMFFPGRLP